MTCRRLEGRWRALQSSSSDSFSTRSDDGGDVVDHAIMQLRSNKYDNILYYITIIKKRFYRASSAPTTRILIVRRVSLVRGVRTSALDGIRYDCNLHYASIMRKAASVVSGQAELKANFSAASPPTTEAMIMYSPPITLKRDLCAQTTDAFGE